MSRAAAARKKFSQWTLAGPAAAILFIGALLVFAALRTDGFTHGTKAVSELGAFGAPMAGAFNLLGFLAPGALIGVFGLGLFVSLRSGRDKAGAALLTLSGAAFALAGVWPVDMNDRASFASTAHLASATASGLFWALSLFLIGPALAKRFAMNRWGALTPWFGLFLVINVGWQIAWRAGAPILPGYGQRIGFAGYMAWIFVTGALLAARRR